ncbi:MAG TPA: DUF5615 family PIN-like protein [Pyrinomonadaceae bacterium]|nr:DUF5615 family PIN-like protein [Pyrinomonadaceae bacterium]
MRIRLYFDEDAMDNDVVRALRLRGVEVMTAHDFALIGSSDEEQLAHATANGRVLYSFNVSDFMALHVSYLVAGKQHAGIVLAQQQRYVVGEQMRRLLRLVEMKPAESMLNTLEFLSAWG